MTDRTTLPVSTCERQGMHAGGSLALLLPDSGATGSTTAHCHATRLELDSDKNATCTYPATCPSLGSQRQENDPVVRPDLSRSRRNLCFFA